jgi:hypothetical protein
MIPMAERENETQTEDTTMTREHRSNLITGLVRLLNNAEDSIQQLLYSTTPRLETDRSLSDRLALRDSIERRLAMVRAIPIED